MLTISQSIASYLDSVYLARSENTAKTYSNALKVFSWTLEGKSLPPDETPVKKLSENAIVWFSTALKDYSPATERLYLTAATGYYEYLAAEQLAADLDALINQYARNYRLFLSPLTTQEVYQFSHYPKLAKTLLSMPTQFHGGASDPDSALMLAERFFRYDPKWNRRWDPVYMSGFMGGVQIVDWTPVPFSLEEQQELKSQKFRDLPPLSFYCRISKDEGSLQSPVIRASIRDLYRDIYPDPKMVADAKILLAERFGSPVEEVLAEISARQPLVAYNLDRGHEGHERLDELPDIPASVTNGA